MDVLFWLEFQNKDKSTGSFWLPEVMEMFIGSLGPLCDRSEQLGELLLLLKPLTI